MTDRDVTYDRRMGLFTGVMLVTGGIIGSGIFRNPQVVAQRVATAPLTLLAWILGGVIAMIGALVFAELGARIPKAGGHYVYIRDAFGGLPAFLYAWALLLIIGTGAIAAVAVTFADYALSLAHLPESWRLATAGGAIVLLSFINYCGIRWGAVTQNVFTILKLSALGLIIVVGAVSLLGLLPAPAAQAPDPAPPASLVLALGAALVPVLFSYGGWQQTNFVVEEMVAPERNLPRALIIGVAVVVVVYILANATYLRGLGAAGLAASEAPASDAMLALVGKTGQTIVALGIIVSTFGFLNLVILVSPRVYQTVASDGLFFQRFARLHPRFRTPTAAIVVQAIWALVLLRTNRYGQLLDYVVFADWIFFGLAAAALLAFRQRERRGRLDHAPGYRMPGAPVLPALFILAALYVVVGSVSSNPNNALRGAGILLIGVPVYLMWRQGGRTGRREGGTQGRGRSR
jgi:APA family basic amino acid/polyamine antiporter